MPNLLSFFTFSLLAIFTPGPNNIMALCNAGKHGFKKCLPFNLGVAVGFLVVLALGLVFSAALYGALPAVKPVMAAVGAAYMLYLAYKTLKDKPDGEGAHKEHTTFPAGLLLQFINPKGILFGITVAANYLTPYYKELPPLAGFTLLLSVLTMASTSSWAAFGAVFQRFIARHRKVFNIVMALLLVYCALSLFF
jgi:threonine/homoserine/homoserine lactone efflux protein